MIELQEHFLEASFSGSKWQPRTGMTKFHLPVPYLQVRFCDFIRMIGYQDSSSNNVHQAICPIVTASYFKFFQVALPFHRFSVAVQAHTRQLGVTATTWKKQTHVHFTLPYLCWIFNITVCSTFLSFTHSEMATACLPACLTDWLTDWLTDPSDLILFSTQEGHIRQYPSKLTYY